MTLRGNDIKIYHKVWQWTIYCWVVADNCVVYSLIGIGSDLFMKKGSISSLFQPLIEFFASHTAFNLHPTIDNVKLWSIEFAQVYNNTLVLYGFRNSSQIGSHLIILHMWVHKIRINDHLVMILPAHLNHACQLIRIVRHHIVYFMIAVGINFCDDVRVKLGKFLFHLLHLQFLTVQSVSDVVWHWNHAHPKNPSENPATCVLDDNWTLLFQVRTENRHVLFTLVFHPHCIRLKVLYEVEPVHSSQINLRTIQNLDST